MKLFVDVKKDAQSSFPGTEKCGEWMEGMNPRNMSESKSPSGSIISLCQSIGIYTMDGAPCFVFARLVLHFAIRRIAVKENQACATLNLSFPILSILISEAPWLQKSQLSM